MNTIDFGDFSIKTAYQYSKDYIYVYNKAWVDITPNCIKVIDNSEKEDMDGYADIIPLHVVNSIKLIRTKNLLYVVILTHAELYVVKIDSIRNDKAHIFAIFNDLLTKI